MTKTLQESTTTELVELQKTEVRDFVWFLLIRYEGNELTHWTQFERKLGIVKEKEIFLNSVRVTNLLFMQK